MSVHELLKKIEMELFFTITQIKTRNHGNSVSDTN